MNEEMKEEEKKLRKHNKKPPNNSSGRSSSFTHSVTLLDLFYVWVKHFSIMMPKWDKTKQNKNKMKHRKVRNDKKKKQNKKPTNTFDSWCFWVAAPSASAILPNPLDYPAGCGRQFLGKA